MIHTHFRKLLGSGYSFFYVHPFVRPSITFCFLCGVCGGWGWGEVGGEGVEGRGEGGEIHTARGLLFLLIEEL